MTLSLKTDGAERIHSALSREALLHVSDLFRLGQRPGARLTVRDLTPLSGMLRSDGAIGRVAARFGGAAMRPVRAILLDKSPEVRWALTWHQDRVIAVKERRDVSGFNGWSVKNGVVHVQAPGNLMAGMLTLRVHADAVDEDNAPLKILRGSHRLGCLSEAEIERLLTEAPHAVCLADRGDIWVYRTPVVHASEQQRTPTRRRVLQVDYADFALPGGLEWAYSSLH